MIKCSHCGGPVPRTNHGKIRLVSGDPEFSWSHGKYIFCSSDCRQTWWDKHFIASHVEEVRLISSMNILIIPDKSDISNPNSNVRIAVNMGTFGFSQHGHAGMGAMFLTFDPGREKFINDEGAVVKFINGDEMAKKVTKMLADNL